MKIRCRHRPFLLLAFTPALLGLTLFAPLSDARAAQTAAASPGEDARRTTLTMSLERSRLVRLGSDAHTVVVGNPAALNAFLDTPRLLVLVPQGAGVSSLTVLDASGRIVLDQDVMVSPRGPHQVRVTRACVAGSPAGSGGCPSETVLDCGDGCNAPPPPAAAAPAAAGAGQQNISAAGTATQGTPAAAPGAAGAAPGTPLPSPAPIGAGANPAVR